jgi:cytochrome P450
VIGNFYLIDPKDPDLVNGKSLVHKIFRDLAKKYGGAFSFWFGGKYTLVVSTPELAHEALKTKGDIFASRWAPNSMSIITRGKGIALNGDLDRWRKFRTFLMSAMTAKQQGAKAEPIITEEAHSTIALFKKIADANELLPLRLHTKRESLNVVMRQAFGFRYVSRYERRGTHQHNSLNPVVRLPRYSEGLTDEFKEIQDIIGKIFENISAGNPSDYMTFLQYLPGDMCKELREVTAKRDAYLEKWIADHKERLDVNNPKDFLDEMLIKQQESGMTDEDILVKLLRSCARSCAHSCPPSRALVLLLTRSRSLQIILWDVMAGGIDTTATSIEWLIYILIKNPRVQTKMQEELESVVGTKRLPTFADVENLPYTVAVISECFRFKHFAPFGIPHSTTKDTTLGGYRVPKAAQVMINIYALHMDPENWKDPEEFRPERFLEEEKVGQRKSPPPPPPPPARAPHAHTALTRTARTYTYTLSSAKRAVYLCFNLMPHCCVQDLAGFFLHPESHNLKSSSVASYKFLPYGTGKRMCVGSGLGRVVMFLKVGLTDIGLTDVVGLSTTD